MLFVDKIFFFIVKVSLGVYSFGYPDRVPELTPQLINTVINM